MALASREIHAHDFSGRPAASNIALRANHFSHRCPRFNVAEPCPSEAKTDGAALKHLLMDWNSVAPLHTGVGLRDFMEAAARVFYHDLGTCQTSLRLIEFEVSRVSIISGEESSRHLDDDDGFRHSKSP